MLRTVKPDRLKPCPKHLINSNKTRVCDTDIFHRIEANFGPRNVFLNAPYTKRYKPLRNLLWATFVVTGFKPTLASLRDTGTLRLCKICELIQTCRFGVTDLSYDGLHNMPFELGFMTALGKHSTLILVDRKYSTRRSNGRRKQVTKFDSRLSNLKSIDVVYHGFDPKILVNRVLERIANDYLPTRNILKRKKELRDQAFELCRVLKEEYDGEIPYDRAESANRMLKRVLRLKKKSK